jgi:hypothetical protein
MIALSAGANVFSAVLLPVASALLLEELTYGGLVRLLLAPKPGPGKRGDSGGEVSPPKCKRGEPNHQEGGRECLH